jgi:hypothetical protein
LRCLMLVADIRRLKSETVRCENDVMCSALAMRGCATGMSRWYLATCRVIIAGLGIFPARWTAAGSRLEAPSATSASEPLPRSAFDGQFVWPYRGFFSLNVLMSEVFTQVNSPSDLIQNSCAVVAQLYIKRGKLPLSTPFGFSACFRFVGPSSTRPISFAPLHRRVENQNSS